MIVKKCPVCGNEPKHICYTSNPPKYGYACCDVHGGYNKDWYEAKNKWNEAVKERSNNNAE